MDDIFLLLSIASLILVLVGMTAPEKSLFWFKGQRTKSKSNKIYLTSTVLFFILCFLTSEKRSNPSNDNYKNYDKSLGSNSSDKVEDKYSNIPTEQKLAILDAETYVDNSDIKVLRIKSLLTDLASMYNEPIDSIAEYTSKAQSVLHDRGIKESCLNILTDMRRAGKVDKTTYKDAVTLFIMVEDYNH